MSIDSFVNKLIMNKAGIEILPHKRCVFSVWAPEKESMILHIVHPYDKEIKMDKDYLGYFSVTAGDVTVGAKYFYRPDQEDDSPDPASHYQPEGVHGPSEVIDHRSFCWHDQDWKGIPLKDLILYEIHVGTFTSEGTFEAIIPCLDEIKASGINAIEMMPVSQFPGNRNWGYDGVYPYSVQNSYGGPEGLKLLVDACHSHGIAVFLDVVYNHLGPEGNYLNRFGPYFTGKYKVMWGDAINYDDHWSDGVREYISENPCHWFKNYHIDGLRADAIHMVFDIGAIHIWQHIMNKVRLLEQKEGRKFYVIAESDLNDPKVVKSPEVGGYGFDAQWLDDFHHALYVLIEKHGKERYGDFGQIEQLSKAYSDGFVHSGEMVLFRKRRYGASSTGIPGEKFIVFNQNHDQIGNRVNGERLSVLVDFEHLKLAAAAMLLSPYIPLIFMGEEYGEDSPFLYFVSHSDQKLVEAVREGRKKEFESFKWHMDPPDPQDEKSFNISKINWRKRFSGNYKIMLDWNKKLISLRKSLHALQNMSKNDVRVYLNSDPGLILHRKSEAEDQHVLCFFNFSDEEITFNVPSQSGVWQKILDSRETIWQAGKENGSGSFISPEEIRAKETITIYPISTVVYKDTI